MQETVYKKMYTTLFNAVTDALEQISARDFFTAETILRQAQQTAEDLYLEEP